MSILAVGLSHRTAPLAVREGVAVLPMEQKRALLDLIQVPKVAECALLSTCNRTEVYLVSDGVDGVCERVLGVLCERSHLPLDTLRPHIFSCCDGAAVRHLFEVASGLDSLVMGEPQIAGQVKEAGAAALAARTSKTVLNRLFRAATQASKRARTETGIGTGAVSVSFAAVELAKKIFGHLQGHTAMVLGAGEMSELTARHLMENGVKNLLVASRTQSRAEDLAHRVRGRPVGWEEAMNGLFRADVVVSATSAESHILDRRTVATAMHRRKNRPMFLIDLGMPRDISPEAAEVYNVFLYDLDDLASVVGTNTEKRTQEADRVRRILDEEVGAYMAWLLSLGVVPAIIALRKHFQAYLDAEMARASLSGLNPEQQAEVEALLRRYMNKLLHMPQIRLKQAAQSPDGVAFVEALKFLFDLRVNAPEAEGLHEVRS